MHIKALFVLSLLLNATAYSASSSSLPNIRNSSPPPPLPLRDSRDAPTPNPGDDTAHSSQSSIATLPTLVTSASSPSSKGGSPTDLKTSSFKEKLELLLQQAREKERSALAEINPIKSASLYADAAGIYQLVAKSLKDGQKKQKVINKYEKCLEEQRELLKIGAYRLLTAAYKLHQQNPREPNEKSSEFALQAAQFYIQAGDLQKAADAFSNAAIATGDLPNKMNLYKKALDLYTQSGDSADAQLMQLKYQSVGNALAQQLIESAQRISAQDGENDANQTVAQRYKEAGKYLVLVGKPGDAADCYKNAAEKTCHAKERIQLLQLSAQQHIAANNPTQAQAMQAAADRQQRSLDEHLAKQAARAEKKRQAQLALAPTPE